MKQLNKYDTFIGGHQHVGKMSITVLNHRFYSASTSISPARKTSKSSMKWTPSLRLGFHLLASSASLKTMGSNFHHSTKKKRHQNLTTTSCQWILKRNPLWHGCRTVILMSYVNMRCWYNHSWWIVLQRSNCSCFTEWHSYTHNFLHHWHLQSSWWTANYLALRQRFCCCRGNRAAWNDGIKKKIKQRKM